MPGGHNRRPDAELIEIAKRYRTRTEWAKSDVNSYHAARLRPALFKEAVSHMERAAHPYSGDYVVYAYEFPDKSVYVGLTFNLSARKGQHAIKGPVFEHSRKCHPILKIVASSIRTPDEAAASEVKILDGYRLAGWTVLNSRQAGGLGSVCWRKWTLAAVVEDARRFSTKNEWRLKSQWAWKIARRNGWYGVATAHMPKRNLPDQNRRTTCVTT